MIRTFVEGVRKPRPVNCPVTGGHARQGGNLHLREVAGVEGRKHAGETCSREFGDVRGSGLGIERHGC